mgnify:CR=1 FL=1
MEFDKPRPPRGSEPTPEEFLPSLIPWIHGSRWHMEETGTITLAASHQGGHIVIEVSDDGRGLNRDKILAKAYEDNVAEVEPRRRAHWGRRIAIAAAVAVMMDGTPHHIISIEPAASGAWVQSGRLAHHGSHLAR